MDYKEKYEQALDRAKEMYDAYRFSVDQSNFKPTDFEYIFPELKESEDERIRKNIISWLKNIEGQTIPFDEYNSAIAWLEKQGDKDKLIKELGEYKVKYTQEVLEKHINSMSNKDEEDTDFTIYHPLKNGKGEYECIPYSFYGSLTSFSEDKDLIDFLRTCFYTEEECNEWIKQQKEQKPTPDWMPKFLDELRSKKNYFDWDEHRDIEGHILAIINWIAPNYFKEKEHKPADKVEPKFKVGDWVVITAFEFGDYRPVGKVIDIKFHCDKTGKVTTSYIIKGLDGKLIDDGIDPNISEDQLRYWTIQDAKDGDVLADKDNNIGIYKEIKYIIYWDSYIYLGCDGELFRLFSTGGRHEQTDTHPATKEQRDLLFAKMKEAGYEWDAEKKELKRIKQKPTDKVEPKFKVGDWVIKDGVVAQILDEQKRAFVGLDTNGNDFVCRYDNTNSMRLWTIQDAKNGDVLVDEDNNIGIYKEIEGIYWNSYIYLGCDNRLRGFSIGGSHIQNNTKPATKEQRDLLFQKMKEAGYDIFQSWDTEKLELRKIEQKPNGESWQDKLANLNEKLAECSKYNVRILNTGDGLYMCNILDDGIEDEVYAENFYEDELYDLIDSVQNYLMNKIKEQR